MDKSLAFDEQFKDMDHDVDLLTLFKKAVQKENDYSTLPIFSFHDQSLKFEQTIDEYQ